MYRKLEGCDILLKGLAPHLQDVAAALGEFIQKAHAMVGQRHLRRQDGGEPPPISPASEMVWWGARNGRVVTNAVRSPVRPATRWIRVVSTASARDIPGTMVVSRRASIDLPAPDGDMVSPPATGMASPWS
jgi:hypothetical protein